MAEGLNVVLRHPVLGTVWYWCAAPAGYYPYIPQCAVPWQALTGY
jgi:hypothetical protein